MTLFMQNMVFVWGGTGEFITFITICVPYMIGFFLSISKQYFQLGVLHKPI